MFKIILQSLGEELAGLGQWSNAQNVKATKIKQILRWLSNLLMGRFALFEQDSVEKIRA